MSVETIDAMIARRNALFRAAATTSGVRVRGEWKYRPSPRGLVMFNLTCAECGKDWGWGPYTLGVFGPEPWDTGPGGSMRNEEKRLLRDACAHTAAIAPLLWAPPDQVRDLTALELLAGDPAHA